MKIEVKETKPVFKPITITLETPNEAVTLWHWLNMSYNSSGKEYAINTGLPVRDPKTIDKLFALLDGVLRDVDKVTPEDRRRAKRESQKRLKETALKVRDELEKIKVRREEAEQDAATPLVDHLVELHVYPGTQVLPHRTSDYGSGFCAQTTSNFFPGGGKIIAVPKSEVEDYLQGRRLI